MFDWERITLFLYILMRMSGFVLFSPILARNGIPALVRGGFVMVFTVSVTAMTPGGLPVPATLIGLVVTLLLELFLGFLLAFVFHLFFYIPQLAGELIDTQMGFTMGKTYDAGSQNSLSVTSMFLNIFMFLIFFAANGHHTLLRILLTSGNVVPFGQVRWNVDSTEALVELFLLCTVLAVKLSLPILAAELMGQCGMGILMKAIPQINVFSINIELKVLISLTLIFLLITPFSEFLLSAENQMLTALHELLRLSFASPPG